MKAPQVSVGILFEPKIEFTLHIPYLINGIVVEGKQSVLFQQGQIAWNNVLYDELLFIPTNTDTGSFELEDVTIGINFHWERKENQKFRGSLRIIVEDDKLTAIIYYPWRNSLTSVISSEMSAKASLELLKAHAVISRSWLLASNTKEQRLKIGERAIFKSTNQYRR